MPLLQLTYQVKFPYFVLQAYRGAGRWMAGLAGHGRTDDAFEAAFCEVSGHSVKYPSNKIHSI